MAGNFDTTSSEKLIWTRYFNRMRVLTLTFALTGLVATASIMAGEGPQELTNLKRLSSNAGLSKDEGLMLTIGSVRVAFMERDTDKLAGIIGKKKAYVAIKSRMEEPGYYTGSQVHFIFDKMFRDLRTRSFEYTPRDIKSLDKGRASFRPEWTYVVLGSDKVVTERLHFVFEKEKHGWSISEIKASSK